MSTNDGEQSHVPDQLVDQLVKGYDALNIEIQLLDKQRHELENKLSWAKQQYLDALKRFSPQSSSQDFHTFLDELDEAGLCEAEKRDDWLRAAQKSSDTERQKAVYNIQKAADAREKLAYRQRASEAGYGVRIWNGKSADKSEINEDIERDFTTYNGTSGRLKCPFVAPKRRSSLVNAQLVNGTGMNGNRTPRGSSASRGSHTGRRSKRSSFHDPIRAEICGFEPQDIESPSVQDSAPLCPIRFLDQNSPEEVANYFEKHKHELPRSHEICVKRYQSNEESIRELDERYGNLVSMIQGLGQVHQPMLPDVPDEEAIDDADVDSKDRVQRWASSVEAENGAAEHDEEHRPADAIEQERQAHFDRPLKDVRVGESPSRPWGITIPERFDEVNGMGTKSDHTASPGESALPQELTVEHQTPAKGKCPFDHTKFMTNGMTPKTAHLSAKDERKTPVPQAEDLAPRTPPPPPSNEPPAPLQTQNVSPPKVASPATQVIFNGPVFIGYSPEQAAAFLSSGIFANKV